MTQQPDALTYNEAGVSISKAEQALARMKPHCESTFDKHVLGGIGPFAAAVGLGGLLKDWQIEDPVILFSTDGPGTIPLVAQMARDFVGHSFVPLGYNVAAHCFADMSTAGGRPFAFLDSISSTDVDPDIHEETVQGMAEACREVGCRLVGGETAQLPGMLTPGVTNFEGFAAALVDRQDWIQPLERVKPGQVIVGIEATFPHLNGLSLIRKIVFEKLGMKAQDILPPTGKSVAETLLQKQPNYAKLVEIQIRGGIRICAACHITGGGLYDNIERNLPEGCLAIIVSPHWPQNQLFQWLIEKGNVPMEEAYHTWNMGIGFVEIFEDQVTAERMVSIVPQVLNCRAWVIGTVVKGKRKVNIIF